MGNPVNEKPQLPLTPAQDTLGIIRNQNDLVTQLQKLFFEYAFAINSLSNGGTFSVHRDGTNQTGVSSGVFTKIEWTTADFDANGEFDITTNYRFTPTVAGRYLLTANIFLDIDTAGTSSVLSLFKNDSEFKRGNQVIQAGAADNYLLNLSVVVDANGSTDFFDVRVSHDAGSDQVLDGTSSFTYFTGAWIR